MLKQTREAGFLKALEELDSLVGEILSYQGFIELWKAQAELTAGWISAKLSLLQL